MPSLSLAILDDYASIAPRHFQHISDLTIDSLPETLDPKTPTGLETLARRLEPYDIISTMRERTPFPSTLLAKLPKLKLLLTTGMRNASFDLPFARERGVIVTGTKGNLPPESKREGWTDLPPEPQFTSVNQHAWALLLALCSRIARDDAALKTHPEAWQSGLMIPLGGKTIGLLGLGRLGALMARTAQLAFGMRVLAWSANLTQAKADEAAKMRGCQAGEWRVAGSKEELMREADVLSVHYVLSSRSQGIIGRPELELLKPSAVIVNTSRGPLIDEAALVEVLREGRIRGAALDVFDTEPLGRESVWRGSGEWKGEVVLSPHMGYVNFGTMERWYQEQGEEVERWVRGEGVVNKLN